jgi:hypothetical protein
MLKKKKNPHQGVNPGRNPLSMLIDHMLNGPNGRAGAVQTSEPPQNFLYQPACHQHLPR